MRLEDLLLDVQKTGAPNMLNTLLTFLHAVLDRFLDVERRQDTSTEGLKSMILRLEDRLNAAIAGQRDIVKQDVDDLRAEMNHAHDLLAAAIEDLRAKTLQDPTPDRVR